MKNFLFVDYWMKYDPVFGKIFKMTKYRIKSLHVCRAVCMVVYKHAYSQLTVAVKVVEQCWQQYCTISKFYSYWKMENDNPVIYGLEFQVKKNRKNG